MKPARVILLTYLVLIAVGSLLFYLIEGLDPLSSLFTSASAITVTGLTVLDVFQLSPLGKLLLALLIQVGGLGYMTLSTFFLVALRVRIGVKERIILSEAINYPGTYGLVRFLRRVVLFTFILEGLGAILMSLEFLRYFSLKEALIYGIFHSISAFNNAGFSILPDGLDPFRGDPFLNLTFVLLIFLGGIGFYVLNDLFLFFTKRTRRLTVHTKVVLTFSLFLIAFGFIFILLLEWGNERGLWSLSLKERLLASFFLSVSSRTAGFSTFELYKLTDSTLFLLILLMFIGASPGGTGGGIKTATVFVVLSSIYSYIRGNSESVVLFRRLREEDVHKSMVILSLSFFFTTFSALILSKVENLSLLPSLFEVVSAFSTTGLSTGKGLSLCSNFSALGKIIIIILMVVGKVGITSFAIALMGKPKRSAVKYLPAKILV